jgi:hypothetical protein
MSEAQFNTARNGTNGVVVQASFTDGQVYFDRASVIRLSNGAQGPTGGVGGQGPAGRASLTFSSTTEPTVGFEIGDTWYNETNKAFYRRGSSSWVRILGNVASMDIVEAQFISATTLRALSANVGTFTSSNAQGSMTISGPLITIRDSSNVLRVELGLF